MKVASRKTFSNLVHVGLKAVSMSSSASALVGDSGSLLQSYPLANNRFLTVAQGSVVDFESKKGAIVNAANEGCLFGGGVDGAITSAGGENLAEDRLRLPRLRGGARCYTGDAKVTGPGDYGSLGVPFVIHAVGPNYMAFDEENDVATPHGLLYSAYRSALDCAADRPIEEVAFALLSAGVFRGEQPLGRVLAIGVEAIRDWAKDESNLDSSSVKDVVLYAFTDGEARTLLKVCNFYFLDKKRKSTDDGPAPVEANERGGEKEGDVGSTKMQGKKPSENKAPPKEQAESKQASPAVIQDSETEETPQKTGGGEDKEMKESGEREGECSDEAMTEAGKEPPEGDSSQAPKSGTPSTANDDRGVNPGGNNPRKQS